MKTQGKKKKISNPGGIRTHHFRNRSASVALATNLTTSLAWEVYKHLKISTDKRLTNYLNMELLEEAFARDLRITSQHL